MSKEHFKILTMVNYFDYTSGTHFEQHLKEFQMSSPVFESYNLFLQ